MSLVFYTKPMSQGSIVRWMLEELGEPYDTNVLDYGDAMKSPDYRAIWQICVQKRASPQGATRERRIIGGCTLAGPVEAITSSGSLGIERDEQYPAYWVMALSI